MVKQTKHIRVSKNGVPFKAGSRKPLELPRLINGVWKLRTNYYIHIEYKHEISVLPRDDKWEVWYFEGKVPADGPLLGEGILFESKNEAMKAAINWMEENYNLESSEKEKTSLINKGELSDETYNILVNHTRKMAGAIRTDGTSWKQLKSRVIASQRVFEKSGKVKDLRQFYKTSGWNPEQYTIYERQMKELISNQKDLVKLLKPDFSGIKNHISNFIKMLKSPPLNAKIRKSYYNVKKVPEEELLKARGQKFDPFTNSETFKHLAKSIEKGEVDWKYHGILSVDALETLENIVKKNEHAEMASMPININSTQSDFYELHHVWVKEGKLYK